MCKGPLDDKCATSGNKEHIDVRLVNVRDAGGWSIDRVIRILTS